jgi:hypothetical protein
MSSCSSCHASILWVKTAATGKAMPVDAAPSPEGNLILRDGIAYHESKIPEAERPIERYVSHFATCPNGPKHRKAPTAGPSKAARAFVRKMGDS